MTRTDVYVAAGIVAWLAGAYWIGDGLLSQAEATNRQALATFCTSNRIAVNSEEGVWMDYCEMPWANVAGTVQKPYKAARKKAAERALEQLQD